MGTKIFFTAILSAAMVAAGCTQGEKQEQAAAGTQAVAEAEDHAPTKTQTTPPAAEGTHEHEAAAGHSHASSEIHGGSVVMTPDHHFETVFAPDEVRVYGYDGVQNPINEMTGATVSLTLQTRDGGSEKLTLDYTRPDDEAGRSQGYFAAGYDFGGVEEGAMKAVFTVSGLATDPITFKTAVKVSEIAVYACPMHPEVKGEDPVPCSQCGMSLERQGVEEEGHGHGHDHGDHDH